jgi:tRNA pseudouridine55 synthase
MARYEAVDGVLLLNKPAGLTSNQALQRVKRLLRARKAGHTGSLDPAATGMLPLCFGEATKVCAFLLDADKTYRVTARLGGATDTGDATGSPVDQADVPNLSRQEWHEVLQNFLGNSQQVPPMYSALKKDGKRLYELARKGETIERDPRPIRIDGIELLEVAGKRLVFRVRCSKGTYVRSLVEDIARSAGTVAHTARLHRESVGTFEAAEMLEMTDLEQLAENDPGELRSCLLPPDRALDSLEKVEIDEHSSRKFVSGQAISLGNPAAKGLIRVYGTGDGFLGVGSLAGGGRLAPKRVFRTTEKNS